MPNGTGVEIPTEEQVPLLAALRRARYGSVLSLHLVLWWAAGRTPTDIASVLCGSRSSVYRMVRAYRAGTVGLAHDDDGRLVPPVRTTVLVPTLRRVLLALLKAPPRAYGWCRTRWRGATLAATLQTKRGVVVTADTVRRWLPEIDGAWKRAKLVATDDAPQRVNRLARIRFVSAQLPRGETIVCADELDIHLVPKVGYAWRPTGTPLAVMTPGTHAKHDLAGALDLATGTLHHGMGPRQTHEVFRVLLQTLETAYPAAQSRRSYVVGILITSIRRRPSSHGEPRIRALSCACSRPLVPVPTRSRAPLAMGLTSAPVTIAANACGSWGPMWSRICT
jgi:transposase